MSSYGLDLGTIIVRVDCKHWNSFQVLKLAHFQYQNSFQTLKFKVGFRAQWLIGRQDNVKDVSQKLFSAFKKSRQKNLIHHVGLNTYISTLLMYE